MRRLFVVCGVASLLLVGVPARSVSPLNLCVAKSKTTTCKSAVQDARPPASGNPQVQTKKPGIGQTVKFFFKLSNPNPGDIGMYVVADHGDSNFDAKYTIAGVDVSTDLSNCTFEIVPKKSHIWIVATYKATGATHGTSDLFGVVTMANSGCVTQMDSTFAHLKVP